jgi:GntR family transcriptional regulator
LSFVSDTTDGRSLQLRIADAIRAGIASGQYPPGSKLPGLPALAQTYKASLVTVRLALARLRQEGLIMSQQGVGNFVREQPPVRRYGIGRYSRSVWAGEQPQRLLDAEGAAQGRAVGQDTETAREPAPAWVADRLAGVSEGDPVHVRRRVTTIDGVVNQSADSYFAVATGERNPDLLTGRGAGGHIARISAVSPVTEVQEEITARMPSGPEAARLAIPDGTPVLDIIRTYHTAEGALDVARFIIRADMAAFDYRFPVPD